MQDMHMVPSLITEVAAYKAYLKRHKVKGIVGHSLPVAFHFSMKNNKPIYQWKASINEPWMPENGRCIWAVDKITNQLIIPVDDPFSKNMKNTYDKAHEVVPYIRKYIDRQLKGCTDETSEAYRVKFPLIQYWKNVADSLEGEFGPKEDQNATTSIEDSEEGLPKLSSRFGQEQTMGHDTSLTFHQRRTTLLWKSTMMRCKILKKNLHKRCRGKRKCLWVALGKKKNKLGIQLR